ncbi:putative mitochondrial protein [Tanacetum coccineum]
MREEIEKLREEMRNIIVTENNGGMGQRQQAEPQRGFNNMQFSRVTKIEFPKFGGDDVRGWLFKCEQFFKVDNIADDQKVNLISIHLHDLALMWHRQFVRIMGENMGWPVYRQEQMISFFIVGLQNDIKVAVRMFKPRSLAELYGLAKLQEANLNAMRNKTRTPLLPTPRFTQSNSPYPNSPKPMQLPAPNANWRNRATTSNNAPVRRQLTQNEYEENRAKNLCFYCDKKNIPDHKCPSQMYSLEVLPSNEEDGEEWEEEQEDINCHINCHTPHISLNALTSRNTLQTMRVIGHIGKYEVHILVDSGITHNFIDCEIARKLEYQMKKTCPLQVTVANGNHMVSSSMCRVKWQLKNEYFCADMMVLPLGGCEMVLGIQRLSTLGDITCNVQELRMRFVYNGKIINLRGTQKSAVQWLQRKQMSKNISKQAQLSSMVLCVYPVLNVISATTSDDQPIPTVLQPLLEEYADVFAILKELPPFISSHELSLSEVLEKIHISVFYDILVYSPNMEIHKEHLRMLLQTMRQNKLMAKPSKCMFGTTQVEYLGHIISDKGVAIDPSKVQAMQQWPRPSTIKQLRGFLGLTAKEAFLKLKEAMMSALVLKLPDFNEEFMVETDALREGIRAVLQQQGHRIAYLSKTLSPKHQVLSTYEKEFLAVLQALEKWRGYLLDRHFKIKTDHFSLKYLLDQMISTPTQMKWLPKLMGFDYEIQYKRGIENVVADALFGMQGSPQLLSMVLSSVSSDVQQRIKDSWVNDTEIQALIKKLEAEPANVKHYTWSNGLLLRKGKLCVGNDTSLQQVLIEYFYARTMGGHSGVKVTTHSICALLYWKKIRKHVKQLIRECHVCQTNKHDLVAYPG